MGERMVRVSKQILKSVLLATALVSFFCFGLVTPTTVAVTDYGYDEAYILWVVYHYAWVQAECDVLGYKVDTATGDSYAVPGFWYYVDNFWEDHDYTWHDCYFWSDCIVRHIITHASVHTSLEAHIHFVSS
jgi:hypothetical protein